MPSAPYRFSCHTVGDYDIIKYLAGFSSSADRNVAIKAAIRAQMDEIENGESFMVNLDTFREDITGDIGRVLSILDEIRHSGLPIPEKITYQTLTGEERSIPIENIDKLLGVK